MILGKPWSLIQHVNPVPAAATGFEMEPPPREPVFGARLAPLWMPPTSRCILSGSRRLPCTADLAGDLEIEPPPPREPA